MITFIGVIRDLTPILGGDIFEAGDVLSLPFGTGAFVKREGNGTGAEAGDDMSPAVGDVAF